MSFDCIITQGHIGPKDPQGGLTDVQKREAFNLTIRHLRVCNPDAYIILTGHGLRPDAVDVCDFVYWEDQLRPMDGRGCVANMPAQFFFVHVGLEEAMKKGFDRCLKTRTDSLIGRTNITHWCEDILQEEDRVMLLTQQTGDGRIGDCFMYGDTELLYRTWHKDNKVHHHDGLINTAINFGNCFPDRPEDWKMFLQGVISFRDVIDIPYSCLRYYYHELEENWEEVQEAVLNNTFDFVNYAWGKYRRWHLFDEDHNMTHRYLRELYCRNEFYA